MAVEVIMFDEIGLQHILCLVSPTSGWYAILTGTEGLLGPATFTWLNERICNLNRPQKLSPCSPHFAVTILLMPCDPES